MEFGSTFISLKIFKIIYFLSPFAHSVYLVLLFSVFFLLFFCNWFHCWHVCVKLCLLCGHYTAAGGLCLQVCVKTSSPPTSRALNSCHKVSAIAQTCGGTERLPVGHLSVSVVSPVSHTLGLFTVPYTGTIEVCLVTHHISYGVWSLVEGGRAGSFS